MYSTVLKKMKPQLCFYFKKPSLVSQFSDFMAPTCKYGTTCKYFLHADTNIMSFKS